MPDTTYSTCLRGRPPAPTQLCCSAWAEEHNALKVMSEDGFAGDSCDTECWRMLSARYSIHSRWCWPVSEDRGLEQDVTWSVPPWLLSEHLAEGSCPTPRLSPACSPPTRRPGDRTKASKHRRTRSAYVRLACSSYRRLHRRVASPRCITILKDKWAALRIHHAETTAFSGMPAL